jgi:hypothetical protein
MATFSFRPHIIDQDLPAKLFAQTALADLDLDGRLEFIMGEQYGALYWYKRHAPGHWTRHLLGNDSPSDVGGCVLDVDADGYPDFVTGGAWYRHPRDLAQPFTCHVFDPALRGVHDVQAADLDGDGRAEIITMSDQNDLRWYKIPAEPTQSWPYMVIGPAVHAGVAIGDLDGDGDLDIVRTNVWFENVKGDGTKWQVRPVGPNTYPPADFRPYFAYDGVRAVVCDINGDGKQDIVFTDAEIPGGKVWWMENLDGVGHEWRRHEVAVPVPGAPRRGAYHSLAVADFDGDGDLDIFSCEMEAVRGDAPPRWYIWENVDGRGEQWQEHVILDANLGGHEAVVGDLSGSGRLDIIAKPWRAHPDNALGGKMFVLYLEAD